MAGSDREIYLAIRHEVLRFAVTLAGTKDAEDVVSNVITRLLASGRSLGDLENPKAYVMQAVMNESKSLARKKARTGEELELGIGLVASVDGDHDSRIDMLRAVSRLPLRQRATIFLAYWAGYNSPEIARLLGIRPGTARRYLHMARTRLRKELLQ